VLLQLPNAGDDLQAMKKGVMELADLIVVNKADLDPDAAMCAQAQMNGSTRHPTVLLASALRDEGIADFWDAVLRVMQEQRDSGEFAARRRRQSLAWMWEIVQARLLADFRHHPAVRAALASASRDVSESRIAPSAAARALLDLFESPTT
ncbi:MAG: methylmalonyl Co-A mutase-associated GTPase MeaB, partial [Burkholderiaceae bacterium]